MKEIPIASSAVEGAIRRLLNIPSQGHMQKLTVMLEVGQPVRYELEAMATTPICDPEYTANKHAEPTGCGS